MQIDEKITVTITESSHDINFREFWKLLVKNNQAFAVSLVAHQDNHTTLFDVVPVVAYMAKARVPRNVDSYAEAIYVAISNMLRKDGVMQHKVTVTFYEALSTAFKAKLRTFVASHSALESRLSVSKATTGKTYKVL